MRPARIKCGSSGMAATSTTTAAVRWARIAETFGNPPLCETPAMLYSDCERAWIEHRAVKFAAERGWPLPIARSEAAAELVRMRTRKPASVLRCDRDP